MEIKYEKAPDNVVPRCPYCKAQLETIWVISKGRGIVEQKRILVCPHCESFLGYGQQAR